MCKYGPKFKNSFYSFNLSFNYNHIRDFTKKNQGFSFEKS